MSPQKKKVKLGSDKPIRGKRGHDPEKISNKRPKNELITENEEIQSIKRKNFVKACERVSFKAFLNYGERLKLISLPPCSKSGCIHQDIKSTSLKQITSIIEESFNIEMKSNMWHEALDVCFLSINSHQYLSDNVLRNVVEIILNAHKDAASSITISILLDRCQQILSLNFNMHPPCTMKSIRNSYIKFLTSPMDLKANTFTNRSQFDCDKGLVKYCLNRLEAELKPESKDGSLIDKMENTPNELTHNVQGLHWQKEKFEIFEMLDRSQRIERLMTVLDSLIELLQLDLAIWHSRYTKNLGSHIMRSHRPLMAHILWSNNILVTGAVTSTCRQIMRLFVHFVHLQYPEQQVKSMTMWLNIVTQTFYYCENNSSNDYPNIGKYCSGFAKEFYKIISVMPPASILRILERILPTFMRHLISKQHLKTILSSQENEDEIINIFLHFIQNMQWEKYPKVKAEDEVVVPQSLNIGHIKPNKLLSYLSKKSIGLIGPINYKQSEGKHSYPKLESFKGNGNDIIDQSYVIYLLYISLQTYLDTYSVQNVQETWDALNDQLNQEIHSDNTLNLSTYSVSETFIKKYRTIYQMLKELVVILHKQKSDGKFPDILKLFETIHLLGL